MPLKCEMSVLAGRLYETGTWMVAQNVRFVEKLQLVHNKSSSEV